jgi:hypothetical protein
MHSRLAVRDLPQECTRPGGGRAALPRWPAGTGRPWLAVLDDLAGPAVLLADCERVPGHDHPLTQTTRGNFLAAARS